jgi:hypothetical protein
MVVEAETGSDEQAKYKANAHACRRLWAFAKKESLGWDAASLEGLPYQTCRSACVAPPSSGKVRRLSGGGLQGWEKPT